MTRPPGHGEDEGDDIIAGGDVDDIRVSLRVIGDDLDPDEVTRLLGVEPSTAAKKGRLREGTKSQTPQRAGIWTLDLGKSREWLLEDLITAVLDRVPVSLEVWRQLGARYKIDLFCGLFLERWNRGVDLSPGLLHRIAERGLALSFDIYCDDDLDA
jgi:hypothetical protein